MACLTRYSACAVTISRHVRCICCTCKCCTSPLPGLGMTASRFCWGHHPIVQEQGPHEILINNTFQEHNCDRIAVSARENLGSPV